MTMVAEHAGAARMTLEQYRLMERSGTDAKHEYYDGYISLMAGGTRRHATLGGSIYALLAEAVAGGPCRAYNSDMRVRLSETVEVYPDVTVTCDERDEENDEHDEIAYPRMAVKVLSPHAERVDRGRKLRDYQSCPTIEEYAMVNSDYQAVEVYRRGARDWTYHRYEAGDEAELDSIGAYRPVAVIYRRTPVPTSPPSPSEGMRTAGEDAAGTSGSDDH
jgi:Uma2 family endonuclease